MKRTKALVLFLAALFCFTTLVGCSSSAKESDKQTSNTITDALNDTYNVDGTQVKLTDGKSEIEAAPGSASKIVTTVWEQPVVGDLNGDKVDDAALILIQDSGGSGTFYYLAASIVSKEDKSTGENAIFLGDRISPKSINIKDGSIIVNYLDRKTDEPMSATPTVEKNLSFKVANDSLVAVNGNKNFEEYVSLIGISEEQLAQTLGEEPTTVDEGGLAFAKTNISVWFGSDGKTVEQVYIGDPKVDFNGVKAGASINDFKKVFGDPILEDTSYANFDYKGLVLNVNYDLNTKNTVSVYVLKEWK